MFSSKSILLHVCSSMLACSILPLFTHAANVRFDLDVTWAAGAPDGNQRQMILMNNQFPGPQLTLNHGDYVQFYVRNNLPFNLTVHFHGIEQKGTPWSDGVPGVTQEQIRPGGSFEYDWTATQHGVYWYHAHSAGLMQDGLYGAILIHPPPGERNPFSMISANKDDIAAIEKAERNAQVIMLSDWTKFTSSEWFAAEKASGLDIYCVDSILINGKGAVNCQPQSTLDGLVEGRLAEMLTKFQAQLSDKGCAPMYPMFLGEGDFQDTYHQAIPPGMQTGCKATNGSKEVINVDAADKWVNLHFVSAMSLKIGVVSIDEHPMWIYAVDGQYIKPQLADSFVLQNGERMSAMIRLDKTPGDYTIRVANNLPNHLISGYGTLSYAHGLKMNGSNPYITYGGKPVSTAVRPLEDDLQFLQPFNAPFPADKADQTIFLTLRRVGYNWEWTLNNHSSFAEDREHIRPLLYAANSTDPTDSTLIFHTKNNTWVDIIFQVTVGPENRAQPVHAMHKHSNRMYLIGRGVGPFKWPSVAEAIKYVPSSFNIANAQYRDSIITATTIQKPSWTAVRYHVENPGAFLLHCHMLTHLQGGMAVVLMDGVDAWPKIPAKYLPH